jgi:hypothetical protein
LKAGIQKSQIMDNILLVVVIFNLISVLATHLEDIKRIEEFRPLLRAAKGEQIPINELKSALIKAIEIMVRALHPVNDSTVKCLISAKQVLEDTLNDII